jgi:hypothetical protein
LAPFLIVIKHLSFEGSYFIIKDWIVKYNGIETLKSSIEYFDNKLKAAINNCTRNRIISVEEGSWISRAKVFL